MLSSAIKHITSKLCKKFEKTKYVVSKILSTVVVELSTSNGRIVGPISVSDLKPVYQGILRTRK